MSKRQDIRTEIEMDGADQGNICTDGDLGFSPNDDSSMSSDGNLWEVEDFNGASTPTRNGSRESEQDRNGEDDPLLYKDVEIATGILQDVLRREAELQAFEKDLARLSKRATAKDIATCTSGLKPGTLFKAHIPGNVSVCVTAEHVQSDESSFPITSDEGDHLHSLECADIDDEQGLALCQEVFVVGHPYAQADCCIFRGHIAFIGSTYIRLDITAVPGLSGAPVLKWISGKGWVVVAVVVSMHLNSVARDEFNDSTSSIESSGLPGRNTSTVESSRQDLFGEVTADKLQTLIYDRSIKRKNSDGNCACNFGKKHSDCRVSQCGYNMRNLNWIASKLKDEGGDLPAAIEEFVCAMSSTGIITAVRWSSVAVPRVPLSEDIVFVQDIFADELDIGSKKKKAKSKDTKLSPKGIYVELAREMSAGNAGWNLAKLNAFNDFMFKHKKVLLRPVNKWKENSITALGFNCEIDLDSVNEKWECLQNRSESFSSTLRTKSTLNSKLTHVGVMFLCVSDWIVTGTGGDESSAKERWFLAGGANWITTGQKESMTLSEGTVGDHTEQLCMYAFFAALCGVARELEDRQFRSIDLYSFTEIVPCDDACIPHFQKWFSPAVKKLCNGVVPTWVDKYKVKRNT
eukprot:m.771562 g.771562  ORF g.771562 m.771562 type:complete len:632 (+) comp23244_c2_seq2:291-2186(+)